MKDCPCFKCSGNDKCHYTEKCGKYLNWAKTVNEMNDKDFKSFIDTGEIPIHFSHKNLKSTTGLTRFDNLVYNGNSIKRNRYAF